ncbi:ThiF family adenylyltransferase [Pseudomonas iridis]|uniref:ThiF family adenylyltransferase n=1 Tax=Pseudomonas TaxID=286 RepID=UPI001B32782C|nr:ThiF family adenylyltransferase [Pseudomonas sp. P42]MBP5952128.1 ThiF family adenylyltransferase [Pseudomonas sp. P42]
MDNQDAFFAGAGYMGIVVPSTLYGVYEGGMYISGPCGVVQLAGQGQDAMLEALQAAGALIPGSAQAMKEVHELLDDPRSSRTVSYLLCGARSCEDVLSDIEALKRSRVLLVGCGGIGSTTSLLLAGSGIGHITVTDGDVIEESNLNRQLFWRRADVGSFKVDVLKEIVGEKFPDVGVETLKRNIDLDGAYDLIQQGFDAVVVTADEPATMAAQSQRLADDCQIPVVSAGYLHRMCMTNFYTGIPSHVVDSTDNVFQTPTLPQFNWQRLPKGVMPSYGPSNFSLAAMLASSVIAALASRTLGSAESHSIVWDANSSPWRFNTLSG